MDPGAGAVGLEHWTHGFQCSSSIIRTGAARGLKQQPAKFYVQMLTQAQCSNIVGCAHDAVDRSSFMRLI